MSIPRPDELIIGWSNFTTIANSGGSPQNMVAYSDDAATATPPTWTAGKVVVKPRPVADCPVSLPDRMKYIWSGANRGQSFPFRQISYTRSLDNGVTWEVARGLAPAPFKVMDQVLGNDRVHEFPTIAVGHIKRPVSRNHLRRVR
jgi:hypothetical protein